MTTFAMPLRRAERAQLTGSAWDMHQEEEAIQAILQTEKQTALCSFMEAIILAQYLQLRDSA